MNLREFNEYVLVFLILFVPQASFNVFYSIVIPFILLVTLTLKKSVSNKTFFILLTGLLLMIYIISKYFVFQNFNDFKELMKVVLFLLVYYSIRRITLSQLEILFLVYIAINFIVSFFQFFHLDFYLIELITSVYSTEMHAEFSLKQNSVRSLGLSPGPGQHGVIALLLFWFFSTLYSFDRPSFMRFLGAILAISSLIMSQSKTCLIVFVFSGLVFVYFIYMLKGNFTRSIVALLLTGAVSLISYYSEDILLQFYDINRIFEAGFEISSMSARLNLWEVKIDAVLSSNPMLIMFGAGRSFLEFNGVHNSSFDNDYVYMFVNYGLLGFTVFAVFMILYLIRNFFRYKRLSLINKIIYMVLLSGGISSLALAFFVDLKIISILALLLAIRNNERLTGGKDSLYRLQ